MNRNIKLLMLVTVLITSLTLTGCWDRSELESKAFVMVVGIDKYDSEKSKTKEEKKPKKTKENALKVTYLLPKFSSIKTGGEEGVTSRQLVSGVGASSYDIARKLTLRSDSQPFFQHMKAVVLGVDIVKDKNQFLETLDGLERQDEISRKLSVFVADDQAADILAVESLLKPLSYKLQGMTQKNIGTNLFIPKTLEETISSSMQGAFLLPKITASKEEIMVAGSAIIKDDEFIGWLDERDTKGVSALTGNTKQEIEEIEFKGVTIPFIAKEVRLKRKAEIIDGKINMNYRLSLSGNIQQYRVKKEPRLTDMKLLAEIEKEIDKRVSQGLYKTVNKLQNEVNADVLNIGDYLETHEPDMWDQVKDDWDKMFPEVRVDIKVDSFIERIGSIK